jgi:hypothetical protein
MQAGNLLFQGSVNFERPFRIITFLHTTHLFHCVLAILWAVTVVGAQGVRQQYIVTSGEPAAARACDGSMQQQRAHQGWVLRGQL